MTQSYIGTKQIMAWAQEKEGVAGYAVKYAEGYISWSPADVFEAAYLPIGHVSHLPLHQQRVIGEKTQLDDKVAKLKAFFGTELFDSVDPREKHRLFDQVDAMSDYSQILGARIAAFTAPVESI